MTVQGPSPTAGRAGVADRPGRPGHGAATGREAARRWLAVAAWAAAGLALLAFFVRISYGARINSDGANSALQGWDLVHGHLLMHGWHLGDATFYAFELPLNGLIQLLLGIGDAATHLSSAVAYLIVAGCAAALAVTNSRGPARAARCAVVIAVLAAPLLVTATVWTLLEEPDHLGTSVFILGSALLIDRAPARWLTAPLLCVILVAGQLSDLTVRYVAVPAIALVCGYRMLADRKLRSSDAVIALAAVASVPLESALYAGITRLGGMHIVRPLARLSPPRLWAQHVPVVWLDIRVLFGATAGTETRLGIWGAALGMACLAASAAGLGRVAWTWRRASRAEQLLAAVIVFNIGTYLVSVMPLPGGSREMAVVLPCGAVLAARACVPARIGDTLRAGVTVAATGLIALVPLASAATRPALRPATAPLAAWLEAHHLRYGVAGYWDASITTMQSGNRVQIRAVDLHPHVGARGWNINIPGWESNLVWYDPARYDGTFAVADLRGRYPATAFEQFFGKPAHVYRVADWLVLVYQTNLLRKVLPMLP